MDSVVIDVGEIAWAVLGVKTAKLANLCQDTAIRTYSKAENGTYLTSFGLVTGDFDEDGMLRHDASTLAGASGSPIYQNGKVAGMHWGASPSHGENLLIPLFWLGSIPVAAFSMFLVKKPESTIVSSSSSRTSTYSDKYHFWNRRDREQFQQRDFEANQREDVEHYNPLFEQNFNRLVEVEDDHFSAASEDSAEQDLINYLATSGSAVGVAPLVSSLMNHASKYGESALAKLLPRANRALLEQSGKINESQKQNGEQVLSKSQRRKRSKKVKVLEQPIKMLPSIPEEGTPIKLPEMKDFQSRRNYKAPPATQSPSRVSGVLQSDGRIVWSRTSAPS
jgi:hypothetical protein